MKRVSPKVYTEKYYLSDCTGYDDFKKSNGLKLEPRFVRMISEIPIKKGMKILDVGCGRGELVYWAARKGAEVEGIDYAKAAIKLSNKARFKWPVSIKKKTKFSVMDAKKLKYKDKFFDAIIFTEVYEHMYPNELQIAFFEFKRVLRDGGFLFIHTAPCKFYNDYTYRYWSYPLSTLIVKLSNLFTGHNYGNLQLPSEIRSSSHKIMHINEPNYFSMKKLLSKSGFTSNIKTSNVTIIKPNISWKDRVYNFLVYLHPLSTKFPFNVIWGNDFFVIARKV